VHYISFWAHLERKLLNIYRSEKYFEQNLCRQVNTGFVLYIFSVSLKIFQIIKQKFYHSRIETLGILVEQTLQNCYAMRTFPNLLILVAAFEPQSNLLP
jgi:hypothetical protein